MTMHKLKVLFFHLSRACGLFHLSRFLMRRRLLILCFHGIALDDEAGFRPSLFMRESLFRQRLETIRRCGFPVLPLPNALDAQADGVLPHNTISITIDDGFYNALSKAAPMLNEYGLPATLYLTSYYVEKGTPIFRLVVQYMFWKTSVQTLDVSDLHWGPDKVIALNDEATRDRATWEIIDYGEQECDEGGRQSISRVLGDRLGVDYHRLVESRIMGLLTPEELPLLQDMGVDLQLHTHRHRLPVDDEEGCHREIRDNRAFLMQALGERKDHLCYPSGVWSKNQWPCLTVEGVKSATTCVPGLNTSKTPPLALYRILDRNDLSQIEFEAELYGFCELIRIFTGKRRRE